MQASKEYLKENKIMSRISFKEKPEHTFTLHKDKLETITGTDGKDKAGVQYLVIEDGEPKTWFTGSPGVIQKVAEYQKGDTLKVTMRSVKNATGAFISVFDVVKVEGGEPVKEVEETEEAEEPKEINGLDDLPVEEEEVDVDDIPF